MDMRTDSPAASVTPHSSNPGTPRAENVRTDANPGTPRVSSNPGTPKPYSNPGTPRTDEVRATPPLAVAAGPSAGPSPRTVQHMPHSQSKYGQLLSVIEEMNKDIRPTYAGSRTSAEKLKRGIVHARILVRECLMECERSARS